MWYTPGIDYQKCPEKCGFLSPDEGEGGQQKVTVLFMLKMLDGPLTYTTTHMYTWKMSMGFFDHGEKDDAIAETTKTKTETVSNHSIKTSGTKALPALEYSGILDDQTSSFLAHYFLSALGCSLQGT